MLRKNYLLVFGAEYFSLEKALDVYTCMYKKYCVKKLLNCN